MKRLFFLTIALLVAITIAAQDESVISQTELTKTDVRISGTVMDKTNHAKLKSVSITVPNTNISTVTNADGYFMLKLKSRPHNIVVSSLGFKRQSVSIDADKMEGMRIYMIPASITLPDLNVWQNDPASLVMAAMDRVSENFVQTKEMHTSFYRETLQKGSRFIDVSEAILSACKKGYDSGINYDRLKVDHGRHIMSQRTKDTLSVKVQGGPMTLINYDVVKNSDILFTDIKEGCYEFRMEIPEELDSKMQIVISFIPRAIRDWPLYSGKIYLDRQTLAFTRIEMSLDVSDQQKATRLLLVKKPNGLRFKPQQLTSEINYRDGRINYLRTYFRFKCDWKKRLFARSYTCCSELVVTDFVTNYTGPNIESKERFSERDALITTIDDMYDPDFWKNYNIIEPTENLEKAILKLKKQK